MIRNGFKDNMIGMNKEFRFRGQEQTRVETFSDAVFALAITMLIISTEVPKDFSEMLSFIADIIPFGLCMALLVYIWYEHFLFFIRYGFKNAKIVFMNAVLLFFILFYVFPLKFLAKLLVTIYSNVLLNLFGGDVASLSRQEMIKPSEMPALMIIYGLGAFAVFFILLLMYRYAYNKKEELKLNEIEIFDTKTSIYSLIIMASIPALSALVSVVLYNFWFSSMISGFIYMLYPVIFAVFKNKRNKLRSQYLPD